MPRFPDVSHPKTVPRPPAMKQFIIPVLAPLLVIFCYGGVAVWLFRRKRFRRGTVPPDEFVLLRGPGESGRREVERLSEKLDELLFCWTPLALALFCVPALVRQLVPNANALALVVCCLVLFVLATARVVQKIAALLEKRANWKLGGLGERHVAEQLQPLTAKGWTLFHDVPKVEEGGQENIDHLLIGPQGLVVVETKTRSKPGKDSVRKDTVSFDGEHLHWPSYAHDAKPVKQVRRCAKWIQNLVKQSCGVDAPVFQMIAIPGWHVETGQHYEPRVTSGRAVLTAFEGMMMGHKNALKQQDVQRITAKLDELCRDVRA